MLRKLIRGSFIVVYQLVAVSIILYFGFWTNYRDTLLLGASPQQMEMQLMPARNIDAATMRLLGSVGQNKLSSYVHFDRAKPLGTIRICTLGDSWTAGSEVGIRADYPSYLQRIFDQHGFDKVQVLNFGNSNYGFAQIYVMWKNVARKYSCDFVLLLPMSFWSARDTTFNHSRGNPGYIHARLVLENEELRLIPPIGETAKQRLDEYVRPVPHWRYLRYDRHPPNIFEAPLPSGRRIPNPFYYDRRSEMEEVTEIYAQIIQSIVRAGPQVVVLFEGWQRTLYSGLISEQSEGIGAAHLSAARPKRFPYVAPGGHPSSWGHELIATAFFRILTGNGESTMILASTQDRKASEVGAPKPLYTYTQVRVTYLGKRAGYFVTTNNKRQDRHDEHMEIFRRRGIGALLALESPDGSIADACLLPLRKVPSNEAELIFVPETAEGARVSLGKAYQLQPDVAIFKVVIQNLPPDGCLPKLIDSGNTRTDTGKQLLLDGEIIARVDRGSIQPNHGPILSLRNSNEYLTSIESLTTSRIMHIELRLDDGEALRRPLLTIQMERISDYLEIKDPPATLIDHSSTPTL